MEYETLDQEEVRKVIKGEPIRSIREVLDADNTGRERAVEEEGEEGEEESVISPATPLAQVGQQQTAKRARGL